MADDKKNETADAIRALAAEMQANNPNALSMTGISLERQRAMVTPPAPKSWRLVPCKSEATGSTFDLHVQQSAKHPEGVITQLHNYKHPDGVFEWQNKNGDGEILNKGLVPMGMEIVDAKTGAVPGPNTPSEALLPHYKQWRWENFYKVDLAYFIGRGMKHEFCARPDGMKTAWIPGVSGGVE